MKFLNSNTVFFRKNKLTMAFIFALGSVSLLACTPDNEVTGSLDQNEFIDRVSERGVFEDWDVNDDNQLSEDEWSQHDEYNLIYESWDQDGDGQLSENEFHEGLYRHYDGNNSGDIEEKEWSEAKNAGWMDI